ncbi:MAG: AMP-binding protein [Candidatus Dormibacteraeota bacterium]|nr:AMP-binding protein [Candidatus Dormibacteraeota bacterium]
MPVSFLAVPELLRSAVARFGDQPAIITSDHSESFRELARSTAAAAGGLRRRGLMPGDRLLLAAPNSPALVHAWLGAIWAGGIPAAINPELTQTEIDYVEEDLQAAIALIRDQVGALDQEQADELPRAATADPMATAAIVYTSGTTSRPKGVMVRHAAYTESGRAFPGWLNLAPPQRLWACLPLFHINAQAYSLMTALAHGFPLALTGKLHATSFWRDARALEVTAVNVVGAMLEFLVAQPESSFVESPLRTIYAAPGPPPPQRDQLEQRFKLRILTGYGMSENPFGCAESPTSRMKTGSIGRPRQPATGAFVNEMRIVPEAGGEAATDEIGELCFRNPVMTPGYWNAADLTAATIVDGWLHTGDAGRRDRDGDVFLAGRYKEIIRRRGENIAPSEVEDVLLAHPSVRAAAVFGIAAGLVEDEAVAVVVLREGAAGDEAELKSWAATRLAAYKIPSRIHFRDSLPTTATHRVAKDALRKEYGKRPSATPRLSGDARTSHPHSELE